MEIKNEAYRDEAQLLQGTSSMVEARYMNYPTHEDATALSQVNCKLNTVTVLANLPYLIANFTPFIDV